MTPRHYSSPLSFKEALEQRLRNSAVGGVDFARRRQLLIFDRFLARISTALGDAAILKGGLVLEFRLKRARTTNDVDLRLTGSTKGLLARLQEAGRQNLGDFLTYEVSVDLDQPVMNNDGLRYDGFRFRAICTLAGKIYGQPFGVDAAFGDPILGEPELVIAQDILDFAGITPPKIQLYPIETHIAEKLHAYTMPRPRPNSRVKDLPDIALLATTRALDARRLREALDQTFTFRATHPLPVELPLPHLAWQRPYAALAMEDQLQWNSLDAVTVAAKEFIDPVLSVATQGTWSPTRWTWV